MPVTFIQSNYCLLHDMGNDHPESPARLHSINDQLIASGLELALQYDDALPASLAHLKRAHNSDFIDTVIAKSPKEGKVQLDDDTFMTPDTLNAALHAAGAGVQAVDTVMKSQSHAAFCSVRPPGHHASASASSGFCLFNNIAVAVCHALEHYQLKRVAIIDFDVHHGNGTEDIFKHDDRVMMYSSFQHPFYPFSGDKNTNTNSMNIPLKAGIKGAEYRSLVSPWFDALNAFKPEMVFISAGFDAHREDDLAHVMLTEADFEWLTQEIKAIANKHCNGRIVSMLEGGYALSALGRSVVAHIKALL